MLLSLLWAGAGGEGEFAEDGREGARSTFARRSACARVSDESGDAVSVVVVRRRKLSCGGKVQVVTTEIVKLGG